MLWLGLALLVIVLDQLSKTLVIGRFALGDSVTVTGWFNLVRAHNTGAAFSFLADAAGYAGSSSDWAAWPRSSSSGCCAPTRASACSAWPSA